VAQTLKVAACGDWLICLSPICDSVVTSPKRSAFLRTFSASLLPNASTLSRQEATIPGPCQTMDGDIYVVPWYPEGVQYIITTSGHHYIGCVDESTILKYPHFKGTSDALAVEAKILQRLGKHPRTIEFKGEHEDGLLLEYASNGSLGRFSKKHTFRPRRSSALPKSPQKALHTPTRTTF
jgi:hypothetical protein